MAGVDVSTRECDGQVVVALRGQLDMAEAAGAAAAFTMICGPRAADHRRSGGPGILTLTRLVDVFPVHETVAEAASRKA